VTDARGQLGAAGRRRRRWALAGLLAGATGIAFAPIFVKSSEAGPVATAFWRVVIALPVLASWLGLRRHAADGRRDRRRPGAGWLILPGLFFAGDLAVWHWSLKLTSAANATLFANAAPVLVVVVGRLWLKERLAPAFFAGLLLALVGAAAVMRASGERGPEALLGDGLGVLTAVFYAGYQLSVKRLRAHFSPAAIMTAAAAVSAAALGAIAVASGERLLATTAAGWGVLVGLALLSHVCGQGLIAWALGHLPVSFSSVSLLWQPVAAALLGWGILSEPLTALQAAGGALVLAGIVLARRGSAPAAGGDPAG